MQGKSNDVKKTYFNKMIKELEAKKIFGARFVTQNNKVMLIIDKQYLSPINRLIIDSINVTYPNVIVSIMNQETPFDYEELYEFGSEKSNRKVAPIDIHNFTFQNENKPPLTYFENFNFVGIELDTIKVPIIEEQIGYFLEFINAFQDQSTNINIENQDKQKCIDFWCKYTGEVIESPDGMKLSDDPFLVRSNGIVLNKEGKKNGIIEIKVKLTRERIKQNYQNYIKRQKDQGNPGGPEGRD